jgi:hypothetical protein
MRPFSQDPADFAYPGFGAVGFGIAALAVGGLLVGDGRDLAGIALDLLGAVLLWSAFTARRG